MPRNYEYQQLIALGISAHIIKEANISPSSYARLYTLLKDFIDPKKVGETLQINAPWQLQLLCKKIDILLHLNVNQATDNLGLNIAHYLALADSVEGLQWVRDNHPILLTSIAYSHRS